MSTLSTTAGLEDIRADVTYCSTCGHRDAVHDATSTRYCAATHRGSIERGCICRGDLTDMGPHSG